MLWHKGGVSTGQGRLDVSAFGVRNRCAGEVLFTSQMMQRMSYVESKSVWDVFKIVGNDAALLC